MCEPILIFAQHHSITVHTLAQAEPGFCVGIKTVSRFLCWLKQMGTAAALGRQAGMGHLWHVKMVCPRVTVAMANTLGIWGTAIPTPGRVGNGKHRLRFQKFISTKIKHNVTQSGMFSYTCILCITLLPIMAGNKKAQIPGWCGTRREWQSSSGTAWPSAATCHSWHWGSRCPLQPALAWSPCFHLFFFFHIPLSLFYSLVLFTHLFSCLSTHNCILLFFSPPLHAPPRNQVFHTMWPSMVLTGIKWAMQGAAGRGRGAASPVSPDPADNRGEHRLPLRRPTGTFGSHSLAQRHSMQFPKFREAIGSTCVHGSHKKDWKKLFYLSC